MDNMERDKKDRSSLEFDKSNDQNDYKFLAHKLRNIKESINLLEKIFLNKEM